MKRSWKALSVAAVSVALVACGGDDDGGGASSSGDFCTEARAADTSGDAVDAALDSGDPDAIKAAFDDALADAERAQDLAPDEIRDAVDTVVDGQRRLIELFGAEDFDVTAIFANEDFQTLIEDESFQTASDDLDAFLARECGIDGDGSADGSSDTPDTAATGDTDTGGTGTIDLGNGDPEAALDQFISLYEIGSGTELTDEQRTCLKDGLRDELTAEQLSEIANSGNVSDDVTTALGLAFIQCDVLTP
jgi:hypothetical protein